MDGGCDGSGTRKRYATSTAGPSRELGLPGIALMECAGAEAAACACASATATTCRVSVLCGPGNNGGDGFVVARHLYVAGSGVERVPRRRGREHDADAGTMRAAAAAFGVPELAPEAADVIVDALFGSGFRGRLEGAAEALVVRANGLAAPMVALDVPSGVDGASGRVEGVAIEAALTLAFHGRTLGTAIEPGRGHSGEVVELPIGLPVALAGPARAAAPGPADLARGAAALADGLEVRRGRRARRRRLAGHERRSGAGRAGGAAARGAGVVWACVPESEHAAVAAHAPELMVHGEPRRRAGARARGPRRCGRRRTGSRARARDDRARRCARARRRGAARARCRRALRARGPARDARASAPGRRR